MCTYVNSNFLFQHSFRNFFKEPNRWSQRPYLIFFDSKKTCKMPLGYSWHSGMASWEDGQPKRCHMSNGKNTWFFRVYVGDEIIPQLCGDYLINHEIRIPMSHKMESKAVFFFSWLISCCHISGDKRSADLMNHQWCFLKVAKTKMRWNNSHHASVPKMLNKSVFGLGECGPKKAAKASCFFFGVCSSVCIWQTLRILWIWLGCCI